jgi:phospholipid/cholesterol/gamma-HCH transport system substrate-binding protein
MTLKRTAAVGGTAILLIALVYAIFAITSGGDAEYKLLFTNTNTLVRGDQVEVGGVPVGTVKTIKLSHKGYLAEVTIGVEDSLTPLHQGTTATIRVPSLSSVANRYISLKPGPNNYPALHDGATIATKDTETAVNLDEIFNTFTPKTKRGLQQLIEGFATQYEGVGHEVNVDSEYFAPALAETNHIFREFVREEKTLDAFLVEAAKAVSVIGAHGQQLSGLVQNGGKALEALGSQEQSLEKGLKELPAAFGNGKRAFAELPAAFAALEKLAEVSKPNTTTLALFFKRLRSLLGVATPVVSALHTAISRPGPDNDLTDFALELPGLAKSLKSSSPAGVKALSESVSKTAPFGPYAPDLQGLFRDFGVASGYYDANGHFLRASPDFSDFELNGEKLVPVAPSEALKALASGQTRRCPGASTQPAADGSSPFTDEGKLECEPSEVTP